MSLKELTPEEIQRANEKARKKKAARDKMLATKTIEKRSPHCPYRQGKRQIHGSLWGLPPVPLATT